MSPWRIRVPRRGYRTSPSEPQPGYSSSEPQPRQRGSAFKKRLILALIIALFALVSYYGKPGDENSVTGEVERVALDEESQEIQLGLQAAPEMAQQHGGPSRKLADRQYVDEVGRRLLNALEKDLRAKGRHNPYYDAFQFTLLADDQVVNAFALPGGQVFITQALYRDLETEGQLAGVLGHEMGHVLSRHGNKQMAKQGLFQGLAGAAGVLGGTEESARSAQMVAAVVGMKFGREHELEADQWGVRLCGIAGYDPRAMIGVMEVLERAGGEGPPEFFSTHPKPANRVKYIKEVIAAEFSEGVPPGLQP